MQEEMEQLKHRITELKNSNAFEHTVEHFTYLSLHFIIFIIINIIIVDVVVIITVSKIETPKYLRNPASLL